MFFIDILMYADMNSVVTHILGIRKISQPSPKKTKTRALCRHAGKKIPGVYPAPIKISGQFIPVKRGIFFDDYWKGVRPDPFVLILLYSKKILAKLPQPLNHGDKITVPFINDLMIRAKAA